MSPSYFKTEDAAQTNSRLKPHASRCLLLMVRPRITGNSRNRRTYKRIAVDYAHKRNVIDYLEGEHDLDATIEFFYGALTGKNKRAKKKQINKWVKQTQHIRSMCDSGHGIHRNLRIVGTGTVLPSDAESDLVLWINSLRKDGAPVSRLMLELQAKEIAKECGLGGKFAASGTWIKRFLRRHKLSLRSRTRQGQTTPEDAVEAAQAFRATVLQTIVEKKCVQVLNADQTAVFFEYLPKQTITTRGSKTVWVKCSNKDKSRATVMLLADWEGKKYPPFMMFKSTPATTKEKREANTSARNGFGITVWREISALQKETNSKIYGNKCAWWNSELSLKFLEYHFAGRENIDDNILLLWDDFSGHWTAEAVEHAASLNVILLKVPPKYTYVCQSADVSWNKPFKSGLCSKWISRLREQLAAYHAGEKRRATKRAKLDKDITRARIDLVQAEADQEVAQLQNDHVEEPFKLQAPNRKDIARWVASCWGDLTPETITSGFRRVGILNDTRCCEVDSDKIESSIVEELESCRLAGESVDFDDDISDSELTSDSEDDEN